jgi:hypothetical protein
MHTQKIVLPRDEIEPSKTFSYEFIDVGFSKVGKWCYCVPTILKASLTSFAHRLISCQTLVVCLKVEGMREEAMPGRLA